jgi:TetR/AcrR family transcriptional regulator, transcriptional repressor for nem operon
MRVSRVQAEKNRNAVIDAAGRLFRERGFDGIGLDEVMKAAGLTHGGFYKQFKSKAELTVEACDRALADGAEVWAQAVKRAGADPFAELIRSYLCRGHRDNRGGVCPLVALGADAARHSPALRRSFETGIKAHLDILDRTIPTVSSAPARDSSIAALSMMVGALLMSRVVEDETLSRRILDAAARHLLGWTHQRRRARASGPSKQRDRARHLPRPTKHGGGA